MHSRIISRYLKLPKRQPDYRENRSHAEFLSTIDAPVQEIKRALADAWHAEIELKCWPEARMKGAIAGIVERSLPQETENTDDCA